MTSYLCKKCGAEALAWTGQCPRCGGTEALTVDERPPDPMVGRTIGGRYTLLRRLGAGGMGTVYEAEQKGVGNRVAVKFLHGNLSRDPHLARRFLHEARTYIRIQHPAAVQLHDFGQDAADGTLFLTMELVDGKDLHALLVEVGALPLGEAVDVALQVADCLAHAHALGVVHRDLKPENVMVRKSLKGFFVKVLDFGISKLVYEGATQMTAAGAIAGTPRYMAPEQIRAEAIDGRADVYALGLVVHELLTGRPVIPDMTVPLVMRHHLEEPLPLLEPHHPALRGTGIDSVLQKACAKQPADRWPTMEAFARALGAVVHRPIAPMEPIPTEPVLPPAAQMMPGKKVEPHVVVPAPPFAATHSPPPVAPIPLGPPVPTPEPSAPKVPTPVPVTSPSHARRSGWMVGAAFVVLLGVAVVATWLQPHAGTTPSGPEAECPGESGYEPSLSTRTTAELRAEVPRLAMLSPSEAAARLSALEAQSAAQPEAKRRCFIRLQLLSLVAANEAALRTDASLYGARRELRALEDDFRTVELRHPWTAEQRAVVLDRVRAQADARAPVKSDADRGYWRRRLVGLLLACEASDAALLDLGVARPQACPTVEP